MPDPFEALGNECAVTSTECLINDHDFGIDARCDRKTKPGLHAKRIGLEWHVHVWPKFGKVDDPVITRLNVGGRHAKNSAAEIDVFPTRQLGMEATAKFENCRHPGANGDLPGRRGRYPSQEPKKGGLPCSITSDDAHDLPGSN